MSLRLCDRASPYSGHLFATDKIGYLYGATNSPLLMTTDAGVHWTPQSGRATVALAVSGGQAIRVSSDGAGCPGPCDMTIDKAPVGSDDWSTIFMPTPAYDDGAQLAWQGSDVYALFPGNIASGAGNQQADLYISQNAGATWSHQADPCGFTGTVANDSRTFSAAPNGVLAVLCEARPGGSDFVILSSNAGASFGTREPIPMPISCQLAAASASNLVVGCATTGGNGPYTYQLRRSSDGGASWQTVVNHVAAITSVVPDFLQFVSASTGWWLAPSTSLWTTTDSGASWNRSGF